MDDAPSRNERDVDGLGRAGRLDGRRTVAVAGTVDKGADAGCDGGNGGANATAGAGSIPNRGIEYIWSHGDPVGPGFKCNYCNKQIKGGGATRFREHLAGIPGNVTECSKVPNDVREVMKSTRLAGRARRRAKKNRRLRVDDDMAEIVDVLTGNDSNCIEIPSDEDDDMQVALRRSLKDLNMSRANFVTGSSSKSRSSTASCVGGGRQVCVKKGGGFDIDLARSRAPVQPRIDRAFNIKEFKEKLGRAWAKWYHANDIAGKKANCPYFRAAIKLTQQLGEGVPCPTGEEIDGPYLQVADPFGAMMDVALFDDTNPITDWLNGSMAESQPILDEADGRPSRELRREAWEASLAGKRKRDNGVKKKRHRKQPNEEVEAEYVGSDSDTTTPCDLETVDSSSSGNETREDDECGDGASEDCEGEAQGQDEATDQNQTGEDNTNRPVRNCRKKTVNVHSLIYGNKK
ncbi:hypothetical protein EJB05_47252, partial [Eragrostis curvula]